MHDPPPKKNILSVYYVFQGILNVFLKLEKKIPQKIPKQYKIGFFLVPKQYIL